MAELAPVTGYYTLESLMDTSVAGQDRLCAFVARRGVGTRNAQKIGFSSEPATFPIEKATQLRGDGRRRSGELGSGDRANRGMLTPFPRSC